MSRHVSEDENVDASDNEEQENENNSSVEEDNDQNDDGNDNDDSNDDDNDSDGDDNENKDTKKGKNKSKNKNKKDKSSIGSRGSRPGRRKGGSRARDNRYRVYIFKILQQVHPKIGITKTGMDILNSFVEDMFEKICNEAMKLCSFNKTSTISAREISTAAKLILPGELRKHAIMEGEKAVRTYQTKLKDLKEQRKAHRGDKKGVFPGKRKKNGKNKNKSIQQDGDDDE